MSSGFLGQGWRFPVGLDPLGPDGQGKIALDGNEENIRQAIWIILSTAPGERIMRPDFGCGIHDLVFAVNNATTAGLVSEAVRQALLRWEPRIDVQNVQVMPGDLGEVLMISIDYRVRTTNSRFNLVYPFYLERSAT